MASIPFTAERSSGTRSARARPPLSGARKIILFSALGFFLFLAWAAIARVDEVTHGQGTVIPSSKVQLVQSAEPAVVREILVRSGERVRAGQLLVRLDDTQSSSELGQIAAENDALRQRSARLGAEGGVGGGGVGGDEGALLAARRGALSGRLGALNATAEQRRREGAEAAATIASLSQSLQLAQENVDRLAPLAARSIVPQTELATAQREVVDLRGRIAAAREQQGRALAAVSEARAQAAEASAQFRQDALNERSQVTQKIAVNQQTLRGAQGRLSRAELRAPSDGIVNNVQVTTRGGFVQAGQSIMEVVPLGDKLLVETRVRPSDIAFIKGGDKALVKITAYDFSIYGGLDGRVVQISADSIYDEATKEAYFNVIVETDRAFLTSGGRRLPITPGMMTDTQIITGAKSILSYLLKPVLKANSEALSER